jgi:hypothetical protein
MSSITDMVLLPSYQRIIGLGSGAIPLLLAELERKPDHWFWALQAITGEDPVPAASRGNLIEMSAAWLAWGRQRGYQWWHLKRTPTLTIWVGREFQFGVVVHGRAIGQTVTSCGRGPPKSSDRTRVFSRRS